jgi:histone acetyltransferase (RNA polymerase elongator complex component)
VFLFKDYSESSASSFNISSSYRTDSTNNTGESLLSSASSRRISHNEVNDDIHHGVEDELIFKKIKKSKILAKNNRKKQSKCENFDENEDIPEEIIDLLDRDNEKVGKAHYFSNFSIPETKDRLKLYWNSFHIFKNEPKNNKDILLSYV